MGKNCRNICVHKVPPIENIDCIQCLSSHPGKSETKLSEDYTRIETMTKEPVKFQKRQHKTVGVAHTWYPVPDMVTSVVDA